MGTPFGPEGNFVLYTVRTGESLSGIALAYDTTIDVIRASNLLYEDASVWPGTVLVILPGQKDLSSVTKFHVIHIEIETALSDLAKKYSSTVEEIRLLNSLGPDDYVPAGRWLIIPIKK